MNPMAMNPDLTKFRLCEKFHCLPSQLEQEEATIIEKFIVIENKQRMIEANRLKDAELQAKMKGGV